jgi:hypothetical protein
MPRIRANPPAGCHKTVQAADERGWTPITPAHLHPRYSAFIGGQPNFAPFSCDFGGYPLCVARPTPRRQRRNALRLYNELNRSKRFKAAREGFSKFARRMWRKRMVLTRRGFGKAALAAAAIGSARAAINSKFGGVQIGCISYCFRTYPDAGQIIPDMADIGLGEVELMSNHAEALAGMPAMPNFGRRGGGGGGGQGRGPGMPPNAQAGGQPPAGEGRRGGGRAPLTPEQQEQMDQAREAVAKWRAGTAADTLEGRHEEVHRRRNSGGPALLQHERQHEG